MAELTIQQAFDIAFRQHRSGKLADAEALYRQILGHSPRHVQAMQMLAQLAHQRGAAGEAEELLRRAIAIDPQDPDAQNNLGMVLATQRRFEQAVPAFGRALLLRPNFPEAYNNLGNALRAHGNVGDAIRAYQKALLLRPEYDDARENLSGALQERAQRAQYQAAAPRPAPQGASAEPAAQAPVGEAAGEPASMPGAQVPNDSNQATWLEAEEPQTHLPKPSQSAADTELLGEHFDFEQTGAGREAEPPPAEAHPAPSPIPAGPPDAAEPIPLAEPPSPNELGEMPAGPPEPAPESIETPAAMPEPAEADAAFESTALDSETRESESELTAEASPSIEADELELAPEPAPVQVPSETVEEINLAPAPMPAVAPEPQIAEAIAEPAVPAEPPPQTADDFKRRGRARWEQGLYDKAAEDFHAALELNPSDADARTDLGLIRLSQGDFRDGWPAYEAHLAETAPVQALDGPTWDGADLANHRILLRAEQGVADAIQFIRYAPLVSHRGGRVIVRCPPALKNLLADQPGVLLVVSTADPMPKFYTHATLASLPRVFGTTPDTIPADVPYLLPDSRLAEKWYQRVSGEPPGLKVGLALHSTTADPVHPSAGGAPPVSRLSGLWQVSGVRFYNLQQPQEDAGPAAPPEVNLTDWTAELRDLADTAGLISNLDLVITADNAIAHLAGALGRPVWMLLPFIADWRWMIGRADTPWYPTMRLFRQPTSNDWDTPVRQLVEALNSTAKPK